MIKSDEVDDIFCILEASFRKKNSKGMLTCLEILNSQSLCPTAYLKHIPENYHRIVLSIASLKQVSAEDYDEENMIQDISTNKTLASNLLVRISSAARTEDLQDERPPGMRPFGETVNVNERKFEKPSSLKTCLFQLSESNDIDRIVFLLDDILNTHLGKLDYLTTSNFPRILTKLILKYANGDFGFENSDNTKYCIFQNRMIKSLLTIIYHNSDLIFDIISSEVINGLAQIIEECCMYIVENISNYDKKHEYEYKTTFVQSIELFELLLTNHSKENIAEVTTAIRNIIQRINMYFAQQNEEECDTDELGVFYDDLKAYYQDMKKLLMKTETLTNIYDSTSKSRSKMASYATFNKENYVK